MSYSAIVLEKRAAAVINHSRDDQSLARDAIDDDMAPYWELSCFFAELRTQRSKFRMD